MVGTKTETGRQSLYADVTARVIRELEHGRVPWVQPWDSGRCACGMPYNLATGRPYSGINVLILWATVIDAKHSSQAWLTYRQALATGGNIRRGEKGTTVFYAERFVPDGEEERAQQEGREARQFAFLRRFTVFNMDQCEGLPESWLWPTLPVPDHEAIPHADALIKATGADFRIGGPEAFYAPGEDVVSVPPQRAFPNPVDYYRTALHELGHWTGHSSRLNRDQSGPYGGPDYAREELVAELASAFTCASLLIRPTVRHSDYISAWLEVLRDDDRAVFRAASLASKAADYLLQYAPEPGAWL
jgi:antirestriction protein ArdC